METLHFNCDCQKCQSRLADLLRREIEDVARLTGATVSGIGRVLANDPSLHHDLVRGRLPKASSSQRWLDAARDFLLFCTEEPIEHPWAVERYDVPARPEDEDLNITK